MNKNFKRFCLIAVAGLAVSEIILTVVHFVLRSDGEGLPWWAFVLLAALYITFTVVGVCLYFRLKAASEDNFEHKLYAANFDIQRRYRLSNYTATFDVCIDFDSKRFACNLLYKDIIPFSRIANCRMELSSYIGHRTMLSVVMSLRGEGETGEIEIFDNVTLFQTVLPAEIDEVSDDLPNRFPELQVAFDLQHDMDRIYDINVKDGFNSVIVEQLTDADWEEPDDFNEQHYSKPPHGDAHW